MSKEKQIIEEDINQFFDGQCGEHSCWFDFEGELKFCRKCLARYLDENRYRKMPENIGEFSDGYHTFNELYHHRAVLFSVICNMFPEKAWKSKLHDTGDMYDGMFIVGIETEQGQATYHYDVEPYWDMFKVKELEKAPKYDGHTPSDAIERIGKLKQSEGEWVERPDLEGFVCSNGCGEMYTEIKETDTLPKFCPNCGTKMKNGFTIHEHVELLCKRLCGMKGGE